MFNTVSGNGQVILGNVGGGTLALLLPALPGMGLVRRRSRR